MTETTTYRIWSPCRGCGKQIAPGEKHGGAEVPGTANSCVNPHAEGAT